MEKSKPLRRTYQIDRLCTLCEKCVPLCPVQCIVLGTGQYVIDTDHCTACGVCAQVCADEAIRPILTDFPNLLEA